MKDNNNFLDAKQEKAIIALVREPTIARAAKSAEIGETTLYRWLQEEDFNKEYRRVRKEVFSQTISKLQQAGSTKAVQTLEDIMDDKEATSSSRVSASKVVLEMALKTFEVEELVSKIEELEKRLEETLNN